MAYFNIFTSFFNNKQVFTDYFKFITSFFNNKRDLTDYFKFLPEEITSDILSRLPGESIIDCTLVCRNWKSLVSHPSFSKLHNLNNSAADSGKLGFLALISNNDIITFQYFEYNENHDDSTTPIQRIRKFNFTPPYKNFRFVGSCNGLVCLTQGRSVCILNPITKEYVLLPEIEYEWYTYKDGTTSFGYATSTNEYKVVVGIYHVLSFNSLTVHIYTLGSGNGWRDLVDFESEYNVYNWDEPGIFANGALYWVSLKLKRIIYLDLAEEIFWEGVSLPPVPPDSIWSNNRIGVLNGCLCFAIGLDIQEGKYYDIWLLKKEDDIHDKKEGEEHQRLSWNNEVRIDRNGFLAITKSGGVLTYNLCCLNIYDTKNSSSKSLVKFKNWILQVSPHKNTLVSLKELGEEDTKTMDSVEIEDPRSRNYQLKEDGTPEYLFL